MPAVVVNRKGKWVVLSHRGGRVLGTHPSPEAAKKQAAAVNTSLRRQGNL